MTKKDLILLADFIRTHNVGAAFEVNPEVVPFNREHLRTLCAAIAASSTPRFDRARWLGYILATLEVKS